MEPMPEPPSMKKSHRTAWRAGGGAADLMPMDADPDETPYDRASETGSMALEAFRDAWLDGYYARMQWRKRNGVRQRRKPTYPEFWSRVAVGEPDECWPWLDNRRNGYGRVVWEGKLLSAHRVAWTLTNGPIPPGLLILHSCDNRPCCNPRHLRPGTGVENMGDAVSRGRLLGRRCCVGAEVGTSKLTAPQVVELRERVARGERVVVIAADLGVTRSNVYKIMQGRSWHHL